MLYITFIFDRIGIESANIRSLHIMKNIIFLSAWIFCSLTACKESPKKTAITPEQNSLVEYAEVFTVDKQKEYTLINIKNPWDSTKLLQTYVLVDRDKQLPANLPKGTIIRTPVQSAVAYSVVHCTSLYEIGKFDILKGICESKYIRKAEIQQKLLENKVQDLGLASSPDIEKIMELEPEVIFTSPISGQNYGQIEKLRIPIIEVPDYMESHPLGRAEWIRFYSFFVGNETIADSLFNETKNNYNLIKEKVANVQYRPSVFTDTRYQSSWNMPGGKSYLANMLNDAGGYYVWSDDNSKSFLPLPFEAVLDKAGEADYWLIKYHASENLTRESLKKEYSSYALFKAYKEKHVYGCNTFFKDYYEDLPTHPDYILKDFAAIFHPDLFPDYQLKYHNILKD